jgi:hypothetical protein
MKFNWNVTIKELAQVIKLLPEIMPKKNADWEDKHREKLCYEQMISILFR